MIYFGNESMAALVAASVTVPMVFCAASLFRMSPSAPPIQDKVLPKNAFASNNARRNLLGGSWILESPSATALVLSWASVRVSSLSDASWLIRSSNAVNCCASDSPPGRAAMPSCQEMFSPCAARAPAPTFPILVAALFVRHLSRFVANISQVILSREIAQIIPLPLCPAIARS
jgi:hypothetical protein